MNRRGFFKTVLGGLAAIVVAPSLPMAFTPKYYSVPVSLSLDEINKVTLAHIMPGIVDNFFKADPLLAYMKSKTQMAYKAPEIIVNFSYLDDHPDY